MSCSAAESTPLRLDENLFANSLEQEAILLSWLVPGGAWVEQGQRVAEVMVEGARHAILAPACGQLVDLVPHWSVVEPGDLLCHVAPPRKAA